MKFYILQSQYCKVTWRYPVEAKDEDEAMEKFYDEAPEPEGEPEIGDAFPGLAVMGSEYEVEAATLLPSTTSVVETKTEKGEW